MPESNKPQRCDKLAWPEGVAPASPEPGDYEKCVRCYSTIEVGQPRKPAHRRGRKSIDEGYGFRHKECPGNARVAARDAARDREALARQAKRAARAPYTTAGPVHVTAADGAESMRSAYKRSAISRIVGRRE